MSWKNVQRNTETGQYRTHDESGGASALTDLSDVNVSSPSDGQVLKYDSTTQKWKNEDESGGGGTVTDVKVDGQSVVNPQTGEAEITMPSVPVQDVQVDGTSVVNQQGVAEITMPTPPTPDYPVTDVKVNGTSVVSNKQALITSYKEVTLAEYMALPDTKLNDGVMYCIKDIGGSNAYPPMIFSTNEREVGVWWDGKPLYQKSFIVPASSMAQGTQDVSTIATDLVNIDMAMLDPAGTYISTRDQNETLLNIKSLSYWDWGINEQGCRLRYDKNSSTPVNIEVFRKTQTNNYYAENNVFTIKYTKSADVAGSGTWTADGAYAHHYSTSEKVVGTWIDGKPLYERIVECGSMPSSAADKTVNHNIANIDKICFAKGFCFDSTNGWGFEVNLTSNSTSSQTSMWVSRTSISLSSMGSDRSSYDATVLIQYTKTTD